MRRSMFEIQIGILKVPAQYGPVKLTYVMYMANVNCNNLKQLLNHLIRHGLIEK